MSSPVCVVTSSDKFSSDVEGVPIEYSGVGVSGLGLSAFVSFPVFAASKSQIETLKCP